MDVKIVLLYVETPLLALLVIEIIAACVLSVKRRRKQSAAEAETATAPVKEESAAPAAPVKPAPAKPAPEAAEYVQGADRFLDSLNPQERAEFYKIFIYNSRCGLRYKIGENNAEFFSGVFINLSGVRFVVSESLMHKICMEYDRVCGLPAAAI